jgi:HPt (histidine-containing phosphotransfer) domain-containing protein
LHELYRVTIDDVLTRAARMEVSLDDGDVATARREAHAVKGACGMVGAAELYALAAAAEAGAEVGRMLVAQFAPACERLKRMLDEKLRPFLNVYAGEGTC